MSPRVVALVGGVGGARLAEGLAAVLPPERLTLVVNTGDDFEHLGLYVCPDLDTVTYTLAGRAHRGQGWGVAGETFRTLDVVRELGGPGWFQLGDQDLGLHIVRTDRRRRGDRLTTITRDVARAFGVEHPILPMSDAPRPTRLRTREGEWLDFQEYLVRRRGTPRLSAIESTGTTVATPEVHAALDAADVVCLAPSNPFVSIEPILGLSGVRARLARPVVVGVSPIISGRAVKGPLAEMIEDLASVPPSARAVAARYADVLDGFLVAPGDGYTSAHTVREADVLMPDTAARAAVARELLALAESARR